MKAQRFGIEIEFTGLTKKAAAGIIAGHFATQSEFIGGSYNAWQVRDSSGRAWKLVNDASIRVEGGEAVELVSPICQYEDIETIQELVRLLRAGGAKANSSCGIHIHIDASTHTARSIRNISNIMVSKEDLIFKALKVDESRARRYCKKAEDKFIDEINRKKPQSLTEVKRLWYSGGDGSRQHYHDSRYHALNLHSVFQKGTIEFRMFNGTTHAGKIKAYIQFCLAISHQAMTQRSASKQKTVTSNDKYTFRTWLLRLGLIGDEFKTARLHLLANLEGNIAWLNQPAA
jgi:hypothetical protein